VSPTLLVAGVQAANRQNIRLFLSIKRSIRIDVMSSSTALEAFLAETHNVIVAGIRKDGRPHLSPNWFYWDGEHFYVSTTRKRAKYTIFRRDPRAELVVDDPTSMRYVEIPTTVEIREDVPANVSLFRAIREKHGRETPPDDELAASLIADDRVLLVFTPSGPQSTWASMNIR
jgi:PPOX class probable F420-dependent enzyme